MPTDGITGRAAHILVHRRLPAAIVHPYVVTMGGTATGAAIDARPGKGLYRALADEARSMYWHDLSLVSSYLREGKCGEISALLTELEELKTRRRPDGRRFKASEDPLAGAPQVFGALRAIALPGTGPVGWRLFDRDGRRQHDRRRGAAAELAFDLERAAMHLDQASC